MIENLRTAYNTGEPFNRDTFRDTLKGTWEKRYHFAIAKNHHAKYIYDAIDLTRSVGLNLSSWNIWSVANIIAGKGFHAARNFLALREIYRVENIYEPRDGQIEAKGYRVDVRKYLPHLYKTIWEQWSSTIWPNPLIAILDNLIFDISFVPFFKPSMLSKIFSGKELSTRERLLLISLSNDGFVRQLAWAYGALGYTLEAIFLLNETLKLNRMDPLRFIGGRKYSSGAYLWYQLGFHQIDAGNLEKAREAFQKAIELDPKYAYPWNGLGYIYFDQGKYDDAIAAYQKAIELNPKDAHSWNSLGNRYTLLHNLEDALVAYQKASELAPEDGKIQSSLAGILLRLGNSEDAKKQIVNTRLLMEKENEYCRACFASICGETEESLRLLKIALDKKQQSLTWARRDPDFDFIRADPRFKELVREESKKNGTSGI